MSFAVLRLRGKGDLRREVKDTLRLLHLTRQNHCAIVPQDPTYRGMLQLVKDYVTWGEVDPEVLAKLLLKRGRQVGDRPIDDAFVKSHSPYKSIWDLSQALVKGEARVAGGRGGTGNAGLHKHKFKSMIKFDPEHFGRHGFTRHAQMHPVTAIDLEDLAGRLAEFEAAGHATKDNSRINVDLTAAGIDKLLGSGRVAVAMRITVAKASEAALAKVAGAGGEVVLPAAGK